MTGYNSKREMSQDKLEDDDDTQVYADTLLIVYQRGFADGKRSEQRKPLTDEEIAAIVRVAAKGSAIKRDGSTSQRIARAIEAALGIKEGT